MVAGGGERRWRSAVAGPLWAAFAIGARDGNGRFCDMASRGAALYLSALGCGDDSALWDTGEPATIEGSGTSAGLVAGALTALRTYKPELTPDQAEQLLLSTAADAPAGKVIDVAAAFRAAGLGGMVDALPAAAHSSPSHTRGDHGRDHLPRRRRALLLAPPTHGGQTQVRQAHADPRRASLGAIPASARDAALAHLDHYLDHPEGQALEGIQLRFASTDREHSHTLTVPPRTVRKLAPTKHHGGQ